MMQRLRISNGEFFAEFPNTNAGMMQAKAFRKNNNQFKRRKIKEILQMLPDKVTMGEIHLHT